MHVPITLFQTKTMLERRQEMLEKKRLLKHKATCEKNRRDRKKKK